MALIRCEECGRMISDRAKSCPKCGCPVTKGKPKSVCPECGMIVSEDDTKCPNCGCPKSMFDSYSNAVNGITPTESTKQHNSMDDDFFTIYNEATNGNVDCMVKLGSAYEYGKGVAEDLNNAIKWYHAAAEKGNKEGMINLARLLALNGDTEKAVSWCDKAKECGYENGYSYIAEYLKSKGRIMGAKYWYKMASEINENGVEDKKAQFENELAQKRSSNYSQSTSIQASNKQWFNGYHVNWLQVAIGIFVLVYGLLIYGSQGKIEDFARYYAQKKNLDFSYTHDYVIQYVRFDTQLFPYPKETYYVLKDDGSKKIVGAYSFWSYTVE